MEFLKILSSVIICCPLIVMAISFILFRKLKIKKSLAVGLAADITTFILFLSVPLVLYSIWEIKIFTVFIIFALVIAIVYTYIEWRKTKEIIVPTLLKRIWRIYFLILVSCYVLFLFMGTVIYIVRYMNSTMM